MDKAAARSFDAQAVDRVRDQNVLLTFQPKLCGRELLHAAIAVEASADHEAPVSCNDLAFRLAQREAALFQSLVLPQEAVIGGDQDVREIGRSQLPHQLHQILDGSLCRSWDIFLGGELVANRVDLVVIQIEDIMIPEEVFALR